MSRPDHIYQPPREDATHEIPGSVAEFLNGRDLSSKQTQRFGFPPSTRKAGLMLRS